MSHSTRSGFRKPSTTHPSLPSAPLALHPSRAYGPGAAAWPLAAKAYQGNDMECQDASSLGERGRGGAPPSPRGVECRPGEPGCLVPSSPRSPRWLWPPLALARALALVGGGGISWHPILQITTLTFIACTGMEVGGEAAGNRYLPRDRRQVTSVHYLDM